MDYTEILSICGYDLEQAHEMANNYCTPDVIEEVLNEIGLEKISAQPDRA